MFEQLDVPARHVYRRHSVRYTSSTERLCGWAGFSWYALLFFEERLAYLGQMRCDVAHVLCHGYGIFWNGSSKKEPNV